MPPDTYPVSNRPTGQLPAGFAAVPITPARSESPLKICIVLHTASQGAVSAGSPVLLHDSPETRTYLGCVLDAGSYVHKWLEISVQNVTAVPGVPATVLPGMESNALLDKRWSQNVAALEQVDPVGLIRTGWESEPPPAVWIDPASMRLIQAVDTESQDAFTLCRDEGALAGAGLPPYGSTLHRYLYLPRSAGKFFIPVTQDAPTGPRTRPLSSLTGDRTDLRPLNLAGLMMVRALTTADFESYIDVLSARPDSRIHTHMPRPNGSDAQLRGPVSDDGWMFSPRQGRHAQALEAFYLKLRAFYDAVAAVQTVVARTGRPMLNLDAHHFRVTLSDPAAALPHLWTARVTLAEGGRALELTIPASDRRYYLAPAGSSSPVYQPQRSTASAYSRALLRVRSVIPETSNGVVVEGTLTTQERIEPVGNDLLWVRVDHATAPIDLYAHVSTDEAPVPGELRFRSVGQQLTAPVGQYLKSLEGASTGAGFSLLPVLDSACDLYSLAVLAVRTFYVNGQNSLPVALDEMLSFARRVAQEYDESAPFRMRLGEVFESQPHWKLALGSHRLNWDKLPADEASELVPQELWTALTAVVVSMFPGVGPDSICRDMCSAPPGAPERVFEPCKRALNDLLVRARSLIVVDWRSNREIVAVIESERARQSPQPSSTRAAQLLASRSS
jgi:hypothetical protein